MICPVVVVVNEIKPFTHASVPLLGTTTGCSSKRLFLFPHGIPQGGIANGLHGLNPRNTAHSTPLCKMRSALVWRLIKKLVHGGNKASFISEQTRHTHLGLIDHSISLERVGYLCIHPWENYCQEQSKG